MGKIKNFIRIAKTIRNWIQYLKDFYLKKSGVLCYKLRKGGRFIIRGNSDDHYIAGEIFVHRVYNPPGFEIKKGDNVVDIGAQIGIFSLYAGLRGANVYSFEPTLENLAILKKNIAINNLRNVHIFNLAVSKDIGEKTFYFCKDKNYTGRHSLYPPAHESEKITVKVTNLAQIIKNNKIDKIDLLKMDCEGAEYDIFFNLSQSNFKKIKKISMEFHDIDKKRNHKTLIQFLIKKGFKIKLNKRFNTMLYAFR